MNTASRIVKPVSARIFSGYMPTVGERLATLEALAREAVHRLEVLEDGLNGGGDVAYERSVRGRLHAIEQYITSKKWLAEYTGRKIKGWHAVILVGCGVVTAVCSVIAALAVLGVV